MHLYFSSSLIFTFFLLFNSAHFTIAALPGDSTDYLLQRPPLDARSLNSVSTLSFYQSPPVTCTYHGVWGCSIWTVAVTLPRSSSDVNPIDLSDPTNPNSTDTLPFPGTSASAFSSALRETCGQSVDGRDNVDHFEYEAKANGAIGVKFRISYARVLEDLCPPPKSCVEEALERLTGLGGGEGEMVRCRMPGHIRDRGPRGNYQYGDA